MIINDGLQEISIDLPSLDSEEWYTVKQESYTLDKETYIEDKFREDFPQIQVKDHDQIISLVSRNRKLQTWYAKTAILYAADIQVPVFLKEELTPEEYLQQKENILKIKKIIAKYSLEKERISAELTAKISKLDEVANAEVDKIIGKDPIQHILNLDASALPLSLSLAIDNYTPVKGDVTIKTRQYSREVLINYKISLIQKVKSDPNFDVFKFTEESGLK